jgi:hypothetical protein
LRYLAFIDFHLFCEEILCIFFLQQSVAFVLFIGQYGSNRGHLPCFLAGGRWDIVLSNENDGRIKSWHTV